MDGSLPGSAVHGIFQARILEWAGEEKASVKWKSALCINLKCFNFILRKLREDQEKLWEASKPGNEIFRYIF